MSPEAIIAVLAVVVGPFVFRFVPLKDAKMRWFLGGVALVLGAGAEEVGGQLHLSLNFSDPLSFIVSVAPAAVALYGAWRIAYELLSSSARTRKLVQ
jgi:hypothetical protein